MSPEQEAAIEAHMRTGRPLGNDAFVAKLEAETGRVLAGKSRGLSPIGIRYCVPGIPPEFPVLVKTMPLPVERRTDHFRPY